MLNVSKGSLTSEYIKVLPSLPVDLLPDSFQSLIVANAKNVINAAKKVPGENAFLFTAWLLFYG